ncbi:MAG: hypothetical protein R3C16_01700 [Hyphomonadaceae bacterium]
MNIPPLPKASKGGRPYALEDKDSERLLTMIIALAAEVSTLHDKMDNLTAVASKATAFDPAAVEAYQPSPEEAAARGARRQAFVQRVLRIVFAESERAAQGGGMSYDEILAMVADAREQV